MQILVSGARASAKKQSVARGRKALMGTSALVAAGLMFAANGAAAQNALDVPAGETTTLGASTTVSSLSGAGTVNLGNYQLTVDQATDTTFSGPIIARGETFDFAHTFYADEGPSYSLAPPVYSGLDAAVFLYGGAQSDYHLSTLSTAITNSNYAYVFGSPLPEVVAEDYSLDGGAAGFEQTGDTSAYVNYSENYLPIYVYTTLRNGGLTKDGVGALTLSGTNSYTGVTQVREGTLALSGEGSIANSAYVSISRDATLDLANVDTGSVSLRSVDSQGTVLLGANTLHITASNAEGSIGVLSGTGGLTIDDRGTASISAAQAYTGATTVAKGGSLFLSTRNDPSAALIAPSSAVVVDGRLNADGAGSQTLQNLSGAGAITASSGLNLIISGDSTYDGTISAYYYDSNYTKSRLTITGGIFNLNGFANSEGGFTIAEGATLNLGDNPVEGTTGGQLQASNGTGVVVQSGGSLSVTRSVDVDINYVISGAGDFVQAGTGTTLLSGDNSFTGSVAINAGTLAVAGGYAIHSNSAVMIGAEGTLELRSNETIGALSGAGTVFVQNQYLTVNQNTDTTFSGVITSATDTPVLVDQYDPRYRGYTGEVGSNPPVYSLQYAAAQYRGGSPDDYQISTSATTITHTGYGYVYTGSGAGQQTEIGEGFTSDIGEDGYNAVGDTSGYIYAPSDQPGGTNYIYTSVFRGGLNKEGTGTLTLTGVNTYAGSTMVTGGTLALRGAGSIADSSYVGLFGGTLDISGVDGGAAYVRVIDGAGAITLGANTLHLTGNGDGETSYTGTISGTGGLTVDGDARFNLSGAQAYTGATTVAAGGALNLVDRLRYDAATEQNVVVPVAIASSVVVVDGTLDTSQARAVTIQSLSGTGHVTLGGTQLRILSDSVFDGALDGSYSYFSNGNGGYAFVAGAASFAGGELTLNGNVNLATLTLEGAANLTLGETATGETSSYTGNIITGSGTVTIDRSDDFSLGAIISGGGNLVQAGTGKTTLTGYSSFTGSVAVKAGTLALQYYALHDAQPVDVAAGATLEINGYNVLGSLSGAGAIVLNRNTLQFDQNTDTIFSGVISSPAITYLYGDLPTYYGNYYGNNDYDTPKTYSPIEAARYIWGDRDFQISTSRDTVTDTGWVYVRGTGLEEHASTYSVDVGAAGYNEDGDASALPANAPESATNYVFLTEASGGIYKSGSGKLTLTGVNSYVGATSVHEGVLALSGEGSVATSALVTVDIDGTFDVAGVSGGAVSIQSLSGEGAVLLGANTLHLTAANHSFAGIIGGTGGLSIDSGQFYLNNAQTYTGATTVAADTLLSFGSTQIGRYDQTQEMWVYTPVTGSIAASSELINNGNVDISEIGTQTIYTGGGGGGEDRFAALSNNYTVVRTPTDFLIQSLSGTNTAAQFQLGANTLVISNANGSYAGVITDIIPGEMGEDGPPPFIGLVTTLDVPVDQSEPVVGYGGVTITGGTQIFTGDNLYSGDTTLAGGNLTLGDGGTTGSVAGRIVLTSGTLTIDHSNDVTFDQVFDGAGSFVQAGTGTTTLNAVNTYTGTTTVSGGTLALGANASIAASSVTNNSVLELSAVDGDVSFLSLSGTGSTLLGANTLTLTNATGSYSGNLSGTGGLTIAAGTETLTGANGYTGATSVADGATLALSGVATLATSGIANAGTLALGGHTGPVALANLTGPGAVTLGANMLSLSAANNLAGVVSGTGGLTVTGGHTILSGANTYIGSTRIEAGTLSLAGTGSLANSSIVNNGTLSIADHSGGVSLSGLTGTGGVTLGANTLSLLATSDIGGAITGAGGLTVAGGTTLLSGASSYTGGTTVATGATLALAGTGTVQGAIANSGTLSLTGTRTLANAVSGSGNLLVTGGTTTLTGAKTYTGTTTISGGTLALGGNGSIVGSSVVNNAVFDVSGHDGDTSVVSLSGTGSTVLGANTLALTNAAGSYSGNLSGTGGLTIAAGTETLTGANSYTGATRVADGATLALSGAATLANSGIANVGTLALSDHTGTLALANLTGAGTVTLGANTLSLSAANNLAGVVSGSGGLAITGGTTLLRAANSYTGGTAVATGATLALAGTGTVQGAIANSGTLSLTGTRTLANAVSGSGNLLVAGGTTTLTGAKTYTGTTTISGGTLALGGNGSITGSSVVNNAVFDVSGHDGDTSVVSLSGTGSTVVGANTLALTNAAGSYSGNLSGTGGLMIAAGTETLTGANGYTGTTTISGGALALGGNGSITGSSVVNNAVFDVSGHSGDTSVVSLSGSGSTVLGANTLALTNAAGSYSGNLSGTGGLTIAAGTETLTGTNGYTGATRVADGATLALSGAATLANSGIANVGTLALSGHTGPLALANLTGAGAVTLGANTLSLSAANAVAGVVSGTGGVTVTGGTTVLSGANSYTGATTVAGGTLVLASGGSFGATSGLALTGADSVLDTSAISGFTLTNLSGVAGSQAKAAGALTLASSVNTSFAGVISGATSLTKTGSGAVLLSGANTIIGPVAISEGTLGVSGGSALSDASIVSIASDATFAVAGSETVANLNGAGSALIGSGATLTFGGDNAAAHFTSFVGTGGLNKIGTGTYTVDNNVVLTGLTTISGGKLILGNAGFAGAVTMAAGTTLAGNGSTGALTIEAGATLDPGAASGEFGTISATSLDTAGTIRIDFGGNTLNSLSDKILVSGAITVTGGTIDAHPVSATSDYTFNSYYALTAGTTFTGEFDNSADFVVNAYDSKLRQRIRYIDGAAVLEVRYLQDLAAALPADSSGNGMAAAMALNGAQAGADDSFAAMINGLAEQGPDARAQSLQELSGEGAISGTEVTGAGLGSFLGVVGSQMGGARSGVGSGIQTAGYLTGARAQTRVGTMASALSSPLGGLQGAYVAGEPGFRTWIQGYGVNQRLDGAAGMASSRTTGAGVAFGAEAYSGSGGIVGVAFGYGAPKSEVAALRSKTEADAFSAAIYGKFTTGNLFVNATVAAALTDLHTTRSVVIGPLAYSPRGSTTAHSAAAQAELGYSVVLGNSRITPSVSASYLRDRIDAYDEVSGGAANLSYGKVSSDRFLTQAGLAWSMTTKMGSTVITPELRGGLAAAMGDRDYTSLARFSGAPTGTGGFTVSGIELPSSWGTAGIGLNIGGNESPVRVSLNYDGSFGSRLTDHQFSGALKFQF